MEGFLKEASQIKKKRGGRRENETDGTNTRKEDKNTKLRNKGRLLFWNIAGIWKKDKEFWNFVKEFDFIGLTETWAENKKWENLKKMLPKGFLWSCQAAERKNKKGKACGGIIIGVREGWEVIEEDKETEGIVANKIKVKEEVWNIWTVYCNKNMENIKRILNEKIGQVRNEIIIMGGDFNARIGLEGGIYRGETDDRQSGRKSKDKMKNKEGERLLQMVEEKGWHILNGNTQDDENGEYTYIEKRGASVIDYLITNNEGWERTEKFTIGSRTESDHQPLIMEVKAEVEETKEEGEVIEKEVVCWNPETITRYKKETEIVEYTEEKGMEEEWQKLEAVVKEKMETKKIIIKRKRVGEHFWWDRECTRKKREVGRYLNKWKKGKADKEAYMEKRAELKRLCDEKIKARRVEEQKEIKLAKSEKQIWNYINKDRKKKTSNENKISAKVWREHFKKLLGGEDKRVQGEKRETQDTGDEETELTEEEIEEQIRKLKKKKSPGSDNLPNEAWIYSSGSTRNKLKEIIKNVWKGKGFPMDWRKAAIVTLYKKGNTENPENYRGISLLSTAYKLYAAIVNERLRKDIEEKGVLPETQAGFRKHRGTIDNAYILKHVVERETGKRRGRVYALFVDLKSAFDTVKRGKLWKNMERMGIRKGLIERVKEIYEETRNVIRSSEGYTTEFWTKDGLRQGCPLSPTLFTIFIADIEEYMRNGIVGGVIVGKERFWSLAYADDMVLLATRKEDLREMIYRLKKYLDKKSLQLNTEKTKVMVFRKGGGKTEKTEWKWKGKNIEVVKEFKYLGIVFQRNGGLERHVRERVKRANIIINQVWGIGERKFKDSFKMRMYLFDTLVLGVLYGVELWGYKEREEVEKAQIKYIKWTLGLDWRTPSYLVLDETKREKIRVRSGGRAIKYEENVRNEMGRTIVKECLREKDDNREETRSRKEREDYLRRNGISQEGLVQLRRLGRDPKEILERRDMEMQQQKQYNFIYKIIQSRYCTRYKYIRGTEIPEYLKKEGKGESQGLIARARCGNLERWNKYWEVEEERTCMLCEDKFGTLEHLVRECGEVERGMCIEEVVNGRIDEKVVKWLQKIERKRKEKETKK